MITTELPNTSPITAGPGLAVKLAGSLLPNIPIEATNDFCYCGECEYKELVFASNSSDWWKNDKSAFLFTKLIAADTITIKLQKNGVDVATISDDTLGTYYSTFTAQPLYVGWVADWKAIYTAHGVGEYQVIAEKVILGDAVNYNFESQIFTLKVYSDLLADGTVRVETYQKGNIRSSVFDYTDLLPNGWYQSYRLRGIFGYKTPKFETDNYISNDYQRVQIQDKIVNEYTLETELLPSNISNALIYDNLLSNEFLITDYNQFNEEIYRRISLYPISVNKDFFGNNRRTKFAIKFVDKFDSVIKSNY